MLSRLLSTLLYLIAPNRCLACAAVVSGDGQFCGDCWRRVHFIYKGCCEHCGLPSENRSCDSCLITNNAGPTTRAVFAYNKVTKRVVARLKFGFGAHLAKPLARLLVQAGADITSDADIVVPVPMHTYSLLKRKYNQAALLAFYFAAHYKLPVNTNALRKVRYTAAQRTKSRAGRQRNLRGSFKCSPQVRNMTVILVDDVITTGATIKECSKALLKAGAKEVRALSLARTLVRNR